MNIVNEGLNRVDTGFRYSLIVCITVNSLLLFKCQHFNPPPLPGYFRPFHHSVFNVNTSNSPSTWILQALPPFGVQCQHFKLPLYLDTSGPSTIRCSMSTLQTPPLPGYFRPFHYSVFNGYLSAPLTLSRGNNNNTTGVREWYSIP